MRKGRIALAVIAAAAVCLAAAWCLTDPMDRSAWLYLAQEDAFARAAEAALAGEPWKKPAGVAEVSLWTSQEDGTVVAAAFFMGGWGIGPQTDYWGVYTTGGGPVGFQGTDMALTEGPNGWTWREETGDNTYETRQIAPGWYSYRAHF